MLTDAECKNATCPQRKTRARLACSPEFDTKRLISRFSSTELQ